MATYTFDKIEYNSNIYKVQDSGALQLTGGQVTGPVTFGDAVTIDEATLGDLVVNGNASFTNNIQANTINGVTVGSSPKFTDTNTEVSTLTLASGSTAGTSLSYGGKYTLTAGSKTVSFTMPASDNTNTTYTLSNALASHKFTETLTAGGSGSGTSTATMEFVAGTGITLTDDTTNKKMTIACSVTNTDTQVSTAAVTSGTTYYPVVGADTTSAATKFYDKRGITYTGTNGTANGTNGNALLALGNSIASTTVDWKKGTLRLYSTNAYYSDLVSGVLTANRTITLPDYTCTLIGDYYSDSNIGWISISPQLTGSSAYIDLVASNNTNAMSMSIRGDGIYLNDYGRETVLIGIQSNGNNERVYVKHLYTPTYDYDAANKLYVDSGDFKSLTVTLNTSWSNKTKTVTASGVTASNTVIVSPAPASYTAYCTCGVYCSAQAANSLTFTCETVPSASLIVNVLYK